MAIICLFAHFPLGTKQPHGEQPFLASIMWGSKVPTGRGRVEL